MAQNNKKNTGPADSSKPAEKSSFDLFGFDELEGMDTSVQPVEDNLDLDSFLDFDKKADPFDAIFAADKKKSSAQKPAAVKRAPAPAENSAPAKKSAAPEKKTAPAKKSSAPAQQPVSEETVREKEKTVQPPRFAKRFAREDYRDDSEPMESPKEKTAGKAAMAKLAEERQRLASKLKTTREETAKPAAKEPQTQPPKPVNEHALQSRERYPVQSAVSVGERFDRSPRPGEELLYDSELEPRDESGEESEARDYLPVRFRRYGRSGIGGGLMYAAFVISLSVILACMGWLFAADVLALSKEEVSASVVVDPYVPTESDLLNEDGDPVDEDGNVITCDIEQVAEALKEGGIIEYKFLFELFSKLSHAYYKIDPGTYDVSTALDYRALVTEMQVGSESQEATRITFPEGYTMDQMFQMLEENNICSAEDLYEAAATHDFSYSWLAEDWYLDSNGDPTRLEGYLFPDTYDFYEGESAINTLNRFLLRFHSILTQDMYQQAENQGITLHEAVIMASLIEKEAGANDDRSNFSSVIYNRLRNGWLLQLDSTINYINNTSTFNLTNADLSTDSPYNTYLYAGLPKGAICNPGLASLTAALTPNSTDYWYWYAFEGETYFFTNSGDFNSFADAHPY